MPARSHPVRTSLWGRHFRGISTEAKLVHVYVLTCPHRRSEGLFEVSPGHIAVDTGLDVPKVEAALEELHAAGLAFYDSAAELVLDPRALKVSPLRNGHDKDGNPRLDNRIKPAVSHFELLPESPLKAKFVAIADEDSPDLAAAIRQATGDYFEPDTWDDTLAPSEGPSQGPSGGESLAPSSAEHEYEETQSGSGRTCRVMKDGTTPCGAPGRWRHTEDGFIQCDQHRTTPLGGGDLVELEAVSAPPKHSTKQDASPGGAEPVRPNTSRTGGAA